MRLLSSTFLLAAAALGPTSAAQAQSGGQIVLAVPQFPTPKNVKTDGGETGVIGIQISQQIASDLRTTRAIYPMGPDGLRHYTPTEAGAPLYPNWAGIGAGALVTGYVQARDDGRINVVCYLYDLKSRREMTRKGFAVAATEWKRAAHRCAGAFYTAVTNRPGLFDSRIAYVAATGSRTKPVKRIAVMNWDGTDHSYLTQGEVTVTSPRLSPDGEHVVYMSFAGGMPNVRITDADGGNDRPLVQSGAMSFAPRYSPDGRQIVFSIAVDGNSDVYVADANGGMPRRLTTTPGIDTSPSFSPDGRQIVFESDRSGTQQVYVMNSDGSGQRRLSFGGGSNSSPVWSPDGERIAFARWTGANINIGIMNASGGDEKILTNGWQDEAPTWSPDSEWVMFQRTLQGSGIGSLQMVSTAGGEPKAVATPQAAADPSWSGVVQ
ncbi:Tol-Pal system beta propeller repeat protein TolB [Sphingomonas daechungensis]|uniref:Tol-Pal system beta propeller repeat protein TolB n=1 Tax=Sphingomonas daechungensis TaxID=1176646 RepID=UPI0031EA8301